MKSIIVLLVLVNCAQAFENGGKCQLACSDKYGVNAAESESIYACNRGCRFSAISQFVMNEKFTEDCENSCSKAYADSTLLESCKFGCHSQGVLSPLGQMLETQPSFFGDPLLSPSSLINSISTFFDDFSNAVSNNAMVPQQGSDLQPMQPIGMIRIVANNESPDFPRTRIISFKLSDNEDPFNNLIGAAPFGSDDLLTSGGNNQLFKTAQDAPSRCLSPTYDSLSGPFCRAYMPRWQFNKAEGKCETFIYGGCPEVSNMFSTEDECKAICSEFISKPKAYFHSKHGFEFWLLVLCFGALGLCALIGACSSACLFFNRRRRQRASQTFATQSHRRQDFLGEEEAKIFLVAPQMSWSSDGKSANFAMPPTYEQVLNATKEISAEEKPGASA